MHTLSRLLPIAVLFLAVACAEREVALRDDASGRFALAGECRAEWVSRPLAVTTKQQALKEDASTRHGVEVFRYPPRLGSEIASLITRDPIRQVLDKVIERLAEEPRFAKVKVVVAPAGEATVPGPGWTLRVRQQTFHVLPTEEAEESYRLSLSLTAELLSPDGVTAWRQRCPALVYEYPWSDLQRPAILNGILDGAIGACVETLWRTLTPS